MVGRNSCLFEAFLTGACFPCKMLHEQLWKVLSFTGEVSTTVNLERRQHADVRLLITTHADNKHLFDGKGTNKDASEKIAEQFNLPTHLVFLVKRRRGACKRMGLVTNGTLFSQTEIPRIPNRNFPKFFVNGKHPVSSPSLRPLIDTCQKCSTSPANHEPRSPANGGFQNPGVCPQAVPSFPSPTPTVLFVALAPFSAQAKYRKPLSSVFLLLPNSTETLATQATQKTNLPIDFDLHNEWYSFTQ